MFDHRLFYEHFNKDQIKFISPSNTNNNNRLEINNLNSTNLTSPPPMQQGSYAFQQTSSSYQQQSSTILVNSGLTDKQGAKNVAKRILDTYDRDNNGVIDSIEVVPMIVDAYKSFNRVFSPSRADIESYLKVLDRNGDGRVTIQDLEDLCAKYLTARI